MAISGQKPWPSVGSFVAAYGHFSMAADTCLNRPLPSPLPWIEDESVGSNGDMWATADESSADVLDLYRQACEHSDAVLAELGPDAVGNSELVAGW